MTAALSLAQQQGRQPVEASSIQRKAFTMTSHMPPVPPANRSTKGPGSDPKSEQDTSIHHPHPNNAAEQGETANIKQNTTNKGMFSGRRVK